MTKPNHNPHTPQEIAIQKLKSADDEFAEDLVRRARSLADPKNGLEDAGFGSVQVLSLLTIYMLAISRRNAAYAYFGMGIFHNFLVLSPGELEDRRPN
jgi:hypothetical protein